jgi:hypothetical protein
MNDATLVDDIARSVSTSTNSRGELTTREQLLAKLVAAFLVEGLSLRKSVRPILARADVAAQHAGIPPEEVRQLFLSPLMAPLFEYLESSGPRKEGTPNYGDALKMAAQNLAKYPITTVEQFENARQGALLVMLEK